MEFLQCYEEILKEIQNNKSLEEIFKSYSSKLIKENKDNNENKNILLKALIRASMYEQEQELKSLSIELDKLQNTIKTKENQMHASINNNFDILFSLSTSQIQKDYLNELMIKENSSTKLLYDVALNAFLNILESANLIAQRSFLLSQFLLINSLEYSSFNKDKIINNADSILQAAFTLANEWQSFANDLIVNTINGLLEGIFTILEKLQEQIDLLASSEEINLATNSLINLENDFIILLKRNINNELAGQILNQVLHTKFDTSFAKFSRLIRENKQKLNLKLISIHNLEQDAKKIYKNFDAKKLVNDLLGKLKK
ncbi:hypothetical protein AVCANL279_05360 [Campylobacter canadensis]|uniref:hypothetical protein n=1 Tax=Campylobacter canadensis TaxID=449520 RepID=UPI001CCCDECC|nr:hypothetical protein [Campylobacter canadensis]MBZ7996752.1 hypothetical protein [Campylobacter canadensis]